MRCTNVITKTFDRNRQINWHFSCQFRSPYPPLPKHELPDQNPANIPTTGAGFTLDLDLSSWDNHLERSWKPSCHPSSKLIGRSGPWWPHLQDFQPTWHLQRSCLWPMSSTKIDEFHSLGLLESVLYITRHTPNKKKQWPVVWWKVIFFGPFKATPTSFAQKMKKTGSYWNPSDRR